MSRVADLGPEYKRLPNIIAEYDDELARVSERLSISGKTLEEANKENSAWSYYYDERRVELKALVHYFENELKRVTAKLYKSYKENPGRNIELTERELLRWLDQDDAMIKVRALALEVQEIYDKFVAIVGAFQSRGYSLNNITKARVAEVHNVIL